MRLAYVATEALPYDVDDRHTDGRLPNVDYLIYNKHYAETYLEQRAFTCFQRLFAKLLRWLRIDSDGRVELQCTVRVADGYLATHLRNDGADDARITNDIGHCSPPRITDYLKSKIATLRRRTCFSYSPVDKTIF